MNISDIIDIFPFPESILVGLVAAAFLAFIPRRFQGWLNHSRQSNQNNLSNNIIASDQIAHLPSTALQRSDSEYARQIFDLIRALERLETRLEEINRNTPLSDQEIHSLARHAYKIHITILKLELGDVIELFARRIIELTDNMTRDAGVYAENVRAIREILALQFSRSQMIY